MNKDTRTDQELNRIIAEWVGFKIHWLDDWRERCITEPDGDKYSPSDPKVNLTGMLPPYSTNLNAIHEAEKKLNDHQSIKYVDRLWLLPKINPAVSVIHVIRATARERAEALVAVIESQKES